MTNLWQQYQNALAMNAKTSFNQLPIAERQQPSPIEQQDETNSSEQKDDDDISEDDSEDRIEATVNDPERLKAFNMFVRLFVDENLDRIIPISKQPKEKIQAIIDSCTRQFPEFAERARKRIRTYLKSCRRNKKTREGWENTVSEVDLEEYKYRESSYTSNKVLFCISVQTDACSLDFRASRTNTGPSLWKRKPQRQTDADRVGTNQPIR